MTLEDVIQQAWIMIEEAQREANRCLNPAERRRLLQYRDDLSEIRQRLRELQATQQQAEQHQHS